MKVVLRKRAINALLKASAFVESMNTTGSGDRWLEKIENVIFRLAASRAKFAICKHPSLAKFNYRCYANNDCVIAFRVKENEFEVCRFIYGPRLE